MKRVVIAVIFVLYACFSFGQSAPKNSFMINGNPIMMASLSYDRILPINEKASLMIGGDYVMGVGFGYGAQWIVPEVNIIHYGPRHFLETGMEFAFDIAKHNPDEPDEEARLDSPGIRLAYRFQSKGGFTLRATANAYFLIDPIFFPTVGLGYSF